MASSLHTWGDILVFYTVFFSNETLFHLDDYMNKQN